MSDQEATSQGEPAESLELHNAVWRLKDEVRRAEYRMGSAMVRSADLTAVIRALEEAEEVLRECPFCGCVPTLDRFNARCPGCDAEINAATRGLAAEMWNRRAPSPAVLALVEACKGLVPTLRSGDWGNQDETADEIDKALAAVEREIGERS